MREYHKINSLWKRDPKGKVIVGDYSIPEFALLQDIPWTWTEKVDGTNIRIGLTADDQFDIRGRTENAQIPTFLLRAITTQCLSTEALRAVFPDTETEFCLYGEGYGQRIQAVGSKYLPDGNAFVLFDVRVGRWWLERQSVEDIAAKLNLPCAPVVHTGPIADAIELVKGGLRSTMGDLEAEGLVGKPVVDLFRRTGERIITKVKAKDLQGLP